jgi:hypothetical protein
MLVLTEPAICWWAAPSGTAECCLLDGKVAAGIAADPTATPIAISLALPRGLGSRRCGHRSRRIVMIREFRVVRAVEPGDFGTRAVGSTN